MAYDSVRAQLDKLLGPDRNGPLTAPNSAPVSYTDPAVCKHYLLGFCPNDLSIKHRSEPGSCPRQHPPAARAAFEADQAAGKLSSEIPTWTRALLVECRAILADEERRIRGNARRLQETYGAKGNLSGLMIKSFDTLKALGMVREDAKIRVLSEMEDRDELTGGDALEPSDSGLDQEASGEVRMEPSDKKPLTEERSSLEAAGNETVTAGIVIGRRSLNDDKDEDDDDDLDGFGVIKVIPAADKINRREDHETTDRNGGGGALNAQGERDNVKKEEVEPPSSKDHSGEKECQEPINGFKTNGDKAENSTAASGAASTSLKLAVEIAAEGKGELPEDSARGASEEAEDKMEEFYRRGIGPDGLLMLDRKQSKRVCALCGGYISLVDAESRLLSHYGGKSHHSLVLLRDKVTELEKVVAAQRPYLESNAGREYHRGRRVYRENRWPRGDERWSRNWDRHKGRMDRDSDRRGYGTTDWQSGSYRGRDGRGRNDERRSGEDYYRRERDNGRYDSGRKRYRSRSPTRSSRRHRHRY